MRKLPYSKQAVKMMLATAITSAPFVAGIPGIGAQKAQAATENEVEDIANKFYDSFYDGADGDILSQASVDASADIDWHIPDGVSEEKEDHYKNIVSSISNVIFTGYSNAGELETAINDFQSESENEDFHAIFGDGTSTTDNFIELFTEIEKVAQDESNLLSFASQSYDEAVEGIVDQAIESGDVSDLEDQLNDGLGIGISGFMNLLGDINAEIDADASARSELISTAVENRDIEITNVNDVDEGDTVSPELKVAYSDSIKANVAKSFNWYLVDGNEEEPFYTKNENGEVEVEVEDAGDYEVVAKLDRLSDNDAEIVAASTAFEVSGSSDSGGSGGSGGSDNSSGDDSDSEDNTTEPDESTYEEETTTDEDGTERVTRTVNADQLADQLEELDEVDNVSFDIEKEDNQRREISLSTEVLDIIRDHHPNAAIEIKSDEGAVRIPVEEFSDDRLRSELGLGNNENSDVSVIISVNESMDENGVLDSNNLNANSPVVEFSASVRSGDNEESLTRFNHHVERDIAGNGSFDEKDNVVLRLDDEGTGYSAAPTIIDEDTATFKTQSFSKYVVVENNVEFDDISSDYWAKEHFDKLGSRFIFQGRDDNTVAPGEGMRRAQFAALLTRSLGLSAEGEYSGEFTDVDTDDWFTEEIQPAIEQGIIQGRTDGTFAPNDSVTRQQAAAMLSRAMEITGYDEEELNTDESVSAFEDVDSIGEWALEDVERLVQAGVIDGRDNGSVFAPKEGTTRAQMSKMLDEYLTFVDFSN